MKLATYRWIKKTLLSCMGIIVLYLVLWAGTQDVDIAFEGTCFCMFVVPIMAYLWKRIHFKLLERGYNEVINKDNN